MKRSLGLILVLLLVILLLGLGLYNYLNLKSQTGTFQAMGTTFNITIKSRANPENLRSAKERILKIEKLLTRYDRNSELSRLNRGEKFLLSDDTKRCLALAKQAKKLTLGAFDARYSGRWNLDGIGKGYAVEEARRLLLNKGVKSAIIDCGSSIAVLGGPFRIGVKHPRKKDELLGVITLNGGEGLSTSGDYERGRHIIDPRTKKPAIGCQAVTVVTKDAGLADGLSTGIFVLGPEKGLLLARDLDLKVLIITTGGKIYEHFGPQLRLFFDKI